MELSHTDFLEFLTVITPALLLIYSTGWIQLPVALCQAAPSEEWLSFHLDSGGSHLNWSG